MFIILIVETTEAKCRAEIFQNDIAKIETCVSQLESRVSKLTCLRPTFSKIAPCVSKGDGPRFETRGAFFGVFLAFHVSSYVSVCFECVNYSTKEYHTFRYTFRATVHFQTLRFHVSKHPVCRDFQSYVSRD